MRYAESGFANASSELERFQDLQRRGVVAGQDIDKVQAAEAMLSLKQPLGPKRAPLPSPDRTVAAGRDHYAAPGPFEWPKSVSLDSPTPIAYASARD